MYTTTDIVIGTLVLIYFIDGLRIGFLRSIITPLSFLICLIIGILNFDLNQNLFKATTVTLIGTTILTVCIKVAFAFSHRTVDEKHREYSSFVSRLAGGLLSFLWKGGLTGLLMLLFMSLPPTTDGIDELQKNIRQSRAYDVANQYLAPPRTAVWNVLATIQVLKDPGKIDALSKAAEVQEMLRYSKTTAMINDPNVMTAIQRGDYIQLLSNPHVAAFLQDDHLMYQITIIAKQLYTEVSSSTNRAPSS